MESVDNEQAVAVREDNFKIDFGAVLDVLLGEPGSFGIENLAALRRVLVAPIY